LAHAYVLARVHAHSVLEMTSTTAFSCHGCSTPGVDGENVEYVGNTASQGKDDHPVHHETCCAARLVAVDSVILRTLENDVRDLQHKVAEHDKRFEELVELNHRVSLLEGPYSGTMSKQTSRGTMSKQTSRNSKLTDQRQVIEADIQVLRRKEVDSKSIVSFGDNPGLEQNGSTDCVSVNSIAEVPTILVDTSHLQGLKERVAEEEFSVLALSDCVARLEQAAVSPRSKFSTEVQDMHNMETGVRVPVADIRWLRDTLTDQQSHVNELLGQVEQMVTPRNEHTDEAPQREVPTPADESRGSFPIESAMNFADVVDLEHKLDANIWEAFVFCGLPLVGIHNSCMLFLSVVFNIAWQAAFCWLIATNPGFAQELLPVATMRNWRETVAHNIQYMDPITHESLAKRVCNNDRSLPVSVLQAELVQDIVHYTDRWLFTEKGYVLLVMVLVLWFMLIARGIRKTWSLSQAMYALPRSGRTVLAGRSHHIFFESLSKGRCSFMMIVAACRILVASMLAVFGSIWLSNTTKIDNLVLKAAALAVVFEFHQVVSVMAVPQQLQMLVSKLDTLKFPKQRFRSGSNLALLGMLLVGPAIAIVVATSAGRVHLERLRDVYKEACGGELNFVYAINPVTGSVVTASSPKGSMANAMAVDPRGARNIVSDIIWHDGLAPRSGKDQPYFVEPLWVVQEVQSKSLSEMSELVSRCKDLPFGRARSLTAALHNATSLLEEHCHVVVR